MFAAYEEDKILFRNARWLNSTGKFEQGDVLIKDEMIAEIAPKISHFSGHVLDASDFIILPAAIDPHVHFREPGQLYKEGILNGSRAALKGGVATVLDMPNNRPPCSTPIRLQQKKQRFVRKSLVNWGLHFQAGLRLYPELNDQIKAAKIYMARSSSLPAIVSIEHLQRIFSAYHTVSIHAEDESVFLPSASGKTLHHELRPVEAVKSALSKIEQALKNLSGKKRPRIIICHMNSACEVDWLERMKNEGFDIRGETAPHYLLFTQDDYIQRGTGFKVNPPLRTKTDQDRLRRGLADGIIDFIGTDHAPHLQTEKQSNQPPSGIAGIEWLMPAMLHMVDEKLINWKQLTELTGRHAAQCYRIEKRGAIRVGNFADLILVQRSENRMNRPDIQTKAGLNLKDILDFRWQVTATLVNGRFHYLNGKFYSHTKGREV